MCREGDENIAPPHLREFSLYVDPTSVVVIVECLASFVPGRDWADLGG